MHVLLFSAIGPSDAPTDSPSRHRAATLARALAERGDLVSWLCAIAPGEPRPTLDAPGVEIVTVEIAASPFRKPLAALSHLPSEGAWMRLLRARPMVAWIGAYAADASIQLPWLAERLGVASILEVTPAAALCHRRTLVDETGGHCTRFDEPQRCVECCLSPGPAGLVGWQRALARSLRGLGDVSPFPADLDMLNRLDSVVGGLSFAREIHVPDARALDALVRIGVAPRKLRVVRPADPLAGVLDAIDRVGARMASDD